MANKPVYQANPFLARALKKLAKKKSEKMIVFLAWENVDCTNNHVERNNRVFRMMQKTRYKRRRTHTIQMALELDLYAHAKPSAVSDILTTENRGAAHQHRTDGIH
jgi:hypothetical protein